MPRKQIPQIDEKEEKIMELVYKFRFINRHQFQKIFNYKDPRRLNARLKGLVEKGFLGRIYSHKLLENTKPAIYYLQNNGILWCQINMGYQHARIDYLDPKHMKKFYEDKHASDIFINHSVAIGEIYLQFKALENKTWMYKIATKNELWTSDLARYAEQEKLYNPDLLIEKTKQTGEESTCYCLELFDPQVPKYALEYKVRQYMELHDDSDWKDNNSGLDQKFPVIFFVLPTQRKLNSLARYIREQLDETYDVEDMEFYLSTYDEVMKEGVKSNIWRTLKATKQKF